jgi:transcriptional antiterminator RfaH
MPLLTREAFLFPDDLFASGRSERAETGEWWVLHTRPRVEKALARRFLARQIPFFLPLYDREWRKHGRLFRSHLPLFPGYVFLRGGSQTRLAALETNQVVRVIPVPDQAQLQTDLERVYRLVTSGQPLNPEERLIPGSRVEIISGPLEGLKGRIIGSAKCLKLFVEVQFLQRGVSVEIERSMIQPLSSSGGSGTV